MADEETKKQKCPAGAPAWMCTFADMMSLLLCFFVLILSFSSLDQVSFDRVAGSLKDAFGVQREFIVWQPPEGQDMISPDFESVPFDVKKEIMEIIAAEVNAGMIEVEEDATAITLRVKDKLAFASGEAKINEAFMPILNKLGKVAEESEAHVIVSGFTDNVPLRKDAPFRSNWALSAARAVAVVEYWTRTFKIPSSRLSAVAYADGRPIASNKTAAGRERNRRVEFRISPTKAGQAFEGIEELRER